ncbi:hypothetical protein AB0M20_04085 [Actinoplanes sp. NPDC051633]|uniref:hypothetical protein n=1 Tax=Actinoplanes sp. NPDC051633 TaxID=3155670 RepID=UPI0034270D95
MVVPVVAGLADHLPGTPSEGLTAQGVLAATAGQIASLPPVGTLSPATPVSSAPTSS